ncbi:MAG: ArsR family transcriptional regulator [Candidatus Methylomirabilales bacterium]|nr:ArsR family transcriptional regulator [candidate division NC10 bacterium]
MNLPDDEIRRKVLTLLDRHYEEDFEALVSVADLANELDLDRPTADRHLAALSGRDLSI